MRGFGETPQTEDSHQHQDRPRWNQARFDDYQRQLTESQETFSALSDDAKAERVREVTQTPVAAPAADYILLDAMLDAMIFRVFLVLTNERNERNETSERACE